MGCVNAKKKHYYKKTKIKIITIKEKGIGNLILMVRVTPFLNFFLILKTLLCVLISTSKF